MLPYRVLVVSALSLVCLACPGTLQDPERFVHDAAVDGPTVDTEAGADGGGCPDVPTQIFAAKCGVAGCHSASSPQQGLDLASPNVGDRITGACAKGGGYLVDPTNPSSSVIYKKLMNPPPFGSQMPLGQPLDDATIACVLAYVSTLKGTLQSCDAGAPPADAGGD
jgi:hypothetical protein